MGICLIAQKVTFRPMYLQLQVHILGYMFLTIRVQDQLIPIMTFCVASELHYRFNRTRPKIAFMSLSLKLPLIVSELAK